ncbi:MAG: spore maturation protein [Clostridiales bacterium]|nr:spore maturation protein [Clostridiales bacterium]
MSKYFIPILFLIIFFYSLIKKVKPYDAFTHGAKSAVPFAVSIFPYLVSIFVLTELFEVSGISNAVSNFLSPVFTLLGIPKELTKLVLIKPFSGSGSLAVLTDIFNTYGVDSYISRCASVIYGSSETVFYVASVYFVGAKTKKLALPITISLIASFFSCVFACFICLLL